MSASTSTPTCVRAGVPLAPLTTLGLGGPARFLATPNTERELEGCLRWARERELRVVALGGGSNVVVADEGVDALVLRLPKGPFEARVEGSEVRLRVGAGRPWDAFARGCVAQGWGGVECLVGIPGTVGATPLQNVGAYGQEIATLVEAVELLLPSTLERRTLTAKECGFSYRDSALKKGAGELRGALVTALRLRLRVGATPCLEYAELARAAREQGARTLSEVAALVLRLRASKGMVLAPEEEEGRTAGSFFVNPIVEEAQALVLESEALRRGWTAQGAPMPSWPAAGGRRKLSAAWLLERCGFTRGLREGPVGVSRRHALALVHLGGARSRELLELAARMQERVRQETGVLLEREPVLLR